MTTLPFDGAISSFYNDEAPEDVREAVSESPNEPILTGGYPYTARMRKKA